MQDIARVGSAPQRLHSTAIGVFIHLNGNMRIDVLSAYRAIKEFEKVEKDLTPEERALLMGRRTEINTRTQATAFFKRIMDQYSYYLSHQRRPTRLLRSRSAKSSHL